MAECVEHVDVLRALTGIEECEHPGLAVSEEDALVAERLPHGVVAGLECLDGLVRLVGQFVGRSVVDRQAGLGA